MKLSTLLIGSAAFVAAFGALEAEGFGGQPQRPRKRTTPHCDDPSRPRGGDCHRPLWDVMQSCDPIADVVCPRGSSKRFVKNSVEPGCAPIPVCFRYKPTNLDQMDDEMEDEMEDDEFVGGKCGIRGGCRL